MNYNIMDDLRANIKKYTSWDYAKDHLKLCVRKPTTEDVIKRNYLDLELYVRVWLDNSASYVLKPDTFPKDPDEIFRMAFAQTYDSFCIHHMDQLLSELVPDARDILEIPTLYCLTNKTKIDGGAVIYYPEYFENIAKKHNSNLVIIPSSIHELLVYVDDTPDIENYNTMVKEVNKNEVAETDQLSDHIYIYDLATGEINF